MQERPGYETPDYSPLRSTGEALFLVAYNWLLEQGDSLVQLGPEYSLTQDVMHSPALVQFRQEWKAEARRAGGRYPVPWHWYKHSIDERDQGPLPLRVLTALGTYYVEHVKLGICTFGLGSPTAEGPIDPVGATIGSLNRISAYPAEPGRVKIVAYNRMGWASALRIPGTRIHPPNRARSRLGPGGTVHWFFYWWEAKPPPVGPWSLYTF